MYAMGQSIVDGTGGTQGRRAGGGAWAVAALLLAAGCGGEDAAPPPAAAAPPETAPPAAKDEAREGPAPVDPSTAGAVTGVVRLGGGAPAPVQLELSGDAFCVGAHPDGLSVSVVTGPAGGLQDALVWIRDDLGDAFTFPEPAPAELRQVGCVYTPRVQVLRKKQVLRVHNDDATLHNIHTRPRANRESNLAQPAGSGARDLDFKKTEGPFEIVCDVHPWMACYVAVVDHPFAAVTGPDGAFALEGVPPGAYELGVWHEQLGERTVSVEVGEGARVEVPPVVMGG